MKTLLITSKESQPTSIGQFGNVSVQVSVDVLQILIFVISTTTCVYAFLAKNRAYLSPMSNILARIKPQDFYKDKKIEAVLNRMLAIGSCQHAPVSRVVVALFTNGTKAHMFPFRYFSIFWEVTNLGVASIKPEYQHKPIDRIRDELEMYMGKDNQFARSSIDNEVTSEGCKRYLKSSGIHTVLGRLIGNRKYGYSGIINIHYDAHPCLSEDQMSELDNLFAILSNEILG